MHFDYEIPLESTKKQSNQKDGIKLTKSLYLSRSTDTVAIVYDFTDVQQPVELILRPIVGLRDFHSLQKSYSDISFTMSDNGLLIRNDNQNGELFLSCPTANFEKDEQWWFNFVYRKDKERGQDFTEDLWTPGVFKCQIASATKIILWANLSTEYDPNGLANLTLESMQEDLLKRQESLIVAAKTQDTKLQKLFLAADQFVVKKQTADNMSEEECPSNERTTILAGFPWFADWGRDAFISLPGLLLSTGRFDDAKSVLTTFAQAADNGLIPNRFDDRHNIAHFNSIDASLWFINAAFQYLDATGDSETFVQQLLPKICWVVNCYQKGTLFNIHADADGLIAGGDSQTQLTWMDAKFGGTAFTPRYGKAVEINALWYNSLCCLAKFYSTRDDDTAKQYGGMADKVKNSFCSLFWNQATEYLNDCVLPDGSVDVSLRPNQIFAVSLKFSPLSIEQQKSVVNIVQRELLTAFGLRTLNTQDNRYKGSYVGQQQNRDGAYHQGTVWPWLIGPFVESYLKINRFSRKSKKQASEFIEPLIQHLIYDSCVGQICEIFDGDLPQNPKGCMAQAWSVAEVLRVYKLINN